MRESNGQAERDRSIVSSALGAAAVLCERGWLQHGEAGDEDKRPCDPSSAQAQCWCASAAIGVALGPRAPMRLRGTAHERLALAISDVGFAVPASYLTEPDELIVGWNDHSLRTREQVVAMLRIAAGPEPSGRCRHCGGTGTVRTEDGRRRRCDRCAGTGRTPTVPPATEMVVCE